MEIEVFQTEIEGIMEERYEIRYGEYGAYFYDIDEDRDVTLEQVKHVMNDKDSGYRAGLEMAIRISNVEYKYFNDDGKLACARVTDKIDSEILLLED